MTRRERVPAAVGREVGIVGTYGYQLRVGLIALTLLLSPLPVLV